MVWYQGQINMLQTCHEMVAPVHASSHPELRPRPRMMCPLGGSSRAGGDGDGMAQCRTQRPREGTVVGYYNTRLLEEAMESN